MSGDIGDGIADEITGRTSSGVSVRLVKVGKHPLDVHIWIDGTRAQLIARGRLYRDGGTREWHTDLGRVVLPHRIGNNDHRLRLDGEIVEPESDSNATP